ncbi:MAG: AraC family transcriptional regulator [Sphingobacteriia bacterium]|nr:MAG: AraC family transcriptional regulator [Sphingobacteriia bacterium]
MPFHFNFRSGWLLVFFFQGLVYAFLFARRYWRNKEASDGWMALFLLLAILFICPWMLGHAGWYNGQTCIECRNFMFYMPFQHSLWIGPVIYFYLQSLLDPGFRFQRKMYYHFLPGALYLLWNVVVAITDRLVLGRYFLMDGENDPDFQHWYILLGLVSKVVYLVLSLRYYARYRAFIVQELSFADTLQFKWVRNFLLAYLVYFFSSLLMGSLVLVNIDIEYATAWWYYLLFGVLFYYIAVTGYAHSIERRKSFSVDFSRVEEPVPAPTLPAENNEPLTEQALPAIWKEKLLAAMESEKAYRDPDLTLTDLAKKLGTNASLLSKVINRNFQVNFNDFVNRYRVEEVKQQLEKGAAAQVTVMGLAYDAGFNSKATFNRAFKKHTGQNPSEVQTMV